MPRRGEGVTYVGTVLAEDPKAARVLILKALVEEAGNLEAAARRLDISMERIWQLVRVLDIPIAERRYLRATLMARFRIPAA
jgi:uncharacterized protein (DUF1778 family)